MKKIYSIPAIVFILGLSTACSLTSRTPKLSKEKAMEMVTETKDLLMGTLMKKIKENGTENALEFCNINAIPLTESVGTKHQTLVKRVSDKNRNPQNWANASELLLINQYKSELMAGKELKPTIEKGNLYVPIVTQSTCLKCHGQPNVDIENKTADKIKILYPKDKATGYKTNEVRGLFVVKL